MNEPIQNIRACQCTESRRLIAGAILSAVRIFLLLPVSLG